MLQLRQKQIAFGDRDVYYNEEGRKMSRLRAVDADWVLRRLERWGKRDNMPFVGPKKARFCKWAVEVCQRCTISYFSNHDVGAEGFKKVRRIIAWDFDDSGLGTQRSGRGIGSLESATAAQSYSASQVVQPGCSRCSSTSPPVMACPMPSSRPAVI